LLTVLDEEAGREDCAWLDASGRCGIYEVRPLVCRTHGLPLVFEEDGRMLRDVCPLNFDEGEGLSGLPTADFLNQDTAFTILAALNHAWAEATGTDPTDRTPLGPRDR
jgi:Fe-S-cluster containining protein